MTKYEPLKAFLENCLQSEVPMSFSEIEKIISAPLPASAFKHRAWWSNNPSNSVITHAWLEAGYHTEKVDLSSHKLVFRKVGSRAPSAAFGGRASNSDGLRARIRAALGGTVRFAPGFDPTEPTGEVWDAEQ